MMIKPALLLLLSFFFIPEINAQTIIDIDGNTYNTVIIGTQQWMKENLKTTHFNNGDPIPTSLEAVDNGPASIYQWSYNDDTLNVTDYGRLYSWFAVTAENNVCPVGWHVPSYDDWLTLSNFLGGDSVAGAKMKEAGTSHWTITNSFIDNSSQFTGLPGGFRGNPSGYANFGTMGNFWSSTPWGSDSFQRAYTFNLKTNAYAMNMFEESVAVANCGLSVRCVSDLSVGLENELPEDNIRIFPNPTTDKLVVSVKHEGSYSCSIIDANGALVFQKEITAKTTSIDLEFLPAGVYLIKMIGEGTSSEQKLVKE